MRLYGVYVLLRLIGISSLKEKTLKVDKIFTGNTQRLCYTWQCG